MSNYTNYEKGAALEDWVEACLESLKGDGLVREHHRLVRSHEHPEFYVQDCADREWLLECKNLAEFYHKRPGKNPVGSKWSHRMSWTRSHILNKKWRQNSYPIQDGNRHAEHSSITVQNTESLRPVLVITHLNFDPDPLQALSDLFGPNVIVFKHQVVGGGPQVAKAMAEIYTRLKQLFQK